MNHLLKATFEVLIHFRRVGNVHCAAVEEMNLHLFLFLHIRPLQLYCIYFIVLFYVELLSFIRVSRLSINTTHTEYPSAQLHCFV